MPLDEEFPAGRCPAGTPWYRAPSSEKRRPKIIRKMTILSGSRHQSQRGYCPNRTKWSRGFVLSPPPVDAAEALARRLLAPVRPRVGADDAVPGAYHARPERRHCHVIGPLVRAHDRPVVALPAADVERPPAVGAHVAGRHWLDWYVEATGRHLFRLAPAVALAIYWCPRGRVGSPLVGVPGARHEPPPRAQRLRSRLSEPQAQPRHRAVRRFQAAYMRMSTPCRGPTWRLSSIPTPTIRKSATVLGDTVVVTDTGVEVLGGMPRELFEVPA
jgi:hypothetical protein